MMADAKAVKWSAFAIIALVACAGAFLLSDSADSSDAASSDGTAGDLTWTLDDSGILTISGTGAMPDYTSVNPAPWGTTVTSVSLYAGITHIGANAFYKCASLVSVTIPDSVTSIGVHAFDGCTSLTSINIPDSVVTLGNASGSSGSVFSGCTSLNSVIIGSSVRYIPELGFSGCTSLTSITIPDSVTAIRYGAFDGCTSLTSITIPDSVTSIGVSAFSGCTSLTSITIPDSVTSIGVSAFSGLSFASSDGTAVEPTAANLAGAIWTRDSLSGPFIAHVWIHIHDDADISGASASILQVVIVLTLVAIVLWIAVDVLRKRYD